MPGHPAAVAEVERRRWLSFDISLEYLAASAFRFVDGDVPTADMKDIYELGFDLTKESIFVSYDATLGSPKQVTKPMLAAIKQAGFDPWLAREDWPAEATAQVVHRP